MDRFNKNSRGHFKKCSDEADDMIYKKMWTRLQYELEVLKKKHDTIETVQYYADGKKCGPPVEKRYEFAMSVDDILKLMCRIDTDIRLEKFGPKIL